jgi:hypothetical protein
MQRNGFERFQRLRVGKAQGVTADSGALFESRQKFAGSYENRGRGHSP